MNRMLFLRDIENDVLIRCRACGHEGVLPRAEAERRFGPSYPVLSIAPHFRCSACNARAAESCAAPLAEEAQVSHVAPPGNDDDDAGFAATLAALQGLVEAAHAPPPVPRRAAPPPPPPPDEEEDDDDGPPAWGRGWAIADRDPPAPAFEPEPEPEPESSPWDAVTDADDDAPAWTPPPPPSTPRPALPARPFFASRERRDPNGDDDDDAAPLSLAQIQALLADDDAGPSLAEMVATEAAPPAADDDDDDGLLAAAFPEDGPPEDEDDPLLSTTLQRLLRHAPNADDGAETETGAETDAAPPDPDLMDDDDRWSVPLDDRDWPVPKEPSPESAGDGDEEPELSDEELIAFAIGDRDAHHDPGELPPELAALLAAGDPLSADLEDEDEVYEYQPGEILADEAGDEGEPVIPRDLIDPAVAPMADAPEPEPEPEPEEPEPAPPPPRLLNEDDDLADFPDPPAWKTQRPPPSADDEEGMEDALSTLRALIEQAAAEPEAEAEPEAAGDGAAADVPVHVADDFPETAPKPRPSPLDDDDDVSWEALMREVAAKAGEPADETSPEPAPEPPAPAVPAPAPPARSGGSLSDTLSRLRGLLDLPDGEEAPSRPPPKKRR